MKRTVLSAFFAAAVLLNMPAIASAKTVLKLGHTGATSHHYHKTSESFKAAVEKRTNGEIEIQIFPADQLGTQRQLVEGVALGTVDMVLTGDQVAAFVPEYNIFSLPYLFDGPAHAAKVMDGEVGDWFAGKALQKGIVVLGYWENGIRHISNSKHPINTPDDLKGIKIRTPNSQITVQFFRLLGAAPTPMGMGEVYSALQLGTVDGFEGASAHMIGMHYYEVQKFYSLTGHQYIAEPLLISKAVFDKLSPEQQKILKEEGKAHALVSRKMVNDEDAALLADLKTKMSVNEVPSLEPFRAVCGPLYDDMKKKYGAEVLDKIRALAKN